MRKQLLFLPCCVVAVRLKYLPKRLPRLGLEEVKISMLSRNKSIPFCKGIPLWVSVLTIQGSLCMSRLVETYLLYGKDN